jgi:chromosome partitioning protein
VTTLAITSQKGGVGKTTLSINLAYAFARSGRKTLLVDTDPQGSVGLSLTRQSRHLSGFYDFLENPVMNVGELIVPTRLPTFSLIAAGRGSAYEFGSGPISGNVHRIRGFVSQIRAMKYDVCIFDTAAGLFGVTADVLGVSNGVMVPQQSEPLGVRSVPKMLEALTRMRAVNPSLQVLGVVLTMVKKELPESLESAQALRGLLPEEMVMQTEIPRNDLYVQASARGLPVGVMAEGAKTLTIFEQLRLELEQRINPPIPS